jgi:hypothetical protein
MLQADSKPCDRLGSARHPVSADAPDAQGRGCAVGQAEVSAEGTIDLAHLARMTCGEKSLEAQVLRLFDRQAGMLFAPMQRFFAQTLAGSARGIGAWEVAAAVARGVRCDRVCRSASPACGHHQQAQAATRALLAIS